jgi:phosphate transport system substrate-binding protein
MTAAPVTGAPADPVLVFAGGGAGVPIVRLLAEAFARTRPDLRIEVPPSIGTTGGIRAAAQGAVAVGLIGRPLRDEEKALGLTAAIYARTALVIAAHRGVADNNITSAALVEIYLGKKTRWSDGHEIIVLTREPGDSTIEILQQKIPGFAAAYAESQEAKRWLTLLSEQQMNETLSRTPHTIGFSDLGAITAQRLSIKVLSLDGVYPLPQHVLSARYPLVKVLAFVYRNEALPVGARVFMDFVKSKEGTRILRANGYLPGE